MLLQKTVNGKKKTTHDVGTNTEGFDTANDKETTTSDFDTTSYEGIRRTLFLTQWRESEAKKRSSMFKVIPTPTVTGKRFFQDVNTVNENTVSIDVNYDGIDFDATMSYDTESNYDTTYTSNLPNCTIYNSALNGTVDSTDTTDATNQV